MARDTGFRKRKPIKIKPLDLLKACCTLGSDSATSLQSIATILGLLTHKTVSKQAVAKRFSASCVKFVQKALFAVIDSLCRLPHLVDQGAFSSFGRVLIQDSTSLKLSSSLAKHFPGNRNQSKQDFAILKIQTIYDALANRFVFFALSGFRRNDQAASQDILSILRPGDLILRDLGYFVLSVIAAISQQRAFFLTRFRLDTGLYSEDGTTPLRLLKLLQSYGKLDRMVCVGDHKKILARLVAVPLPHAVASSRRRKARQNRDKRLSPSKEYLALLGWEIFLTNVSQKTWNPQTLCAVYGVRWKIEIIFKSWKSHFHLTQITSGSSHQIQILILARLIFISLFQTFFFQPLFEHFRDTHQRWLSLLKSAQFFSAHCLTIFHLSKSTHGSHLLQQLLLRHCTYDKRKDRLNFPQILQSLG